MKSCRGMTYSRRKPDTRNEITIKIVINIPDVMIILHYVLNLSNLNVNISAYAPRNKTAFLDNCNRWNVLLFRLGKLRRISRAVYSSGVFLKCLQH